MRRPQKTCAICESGVRVVDYKDERTLSRFLTERGQDPPEPAVGHLRPAPAAAQHRDQARPAAGAAAVHQGLHRLSTPGQVGGPAGGRWGQVLALAGFLLLAPPMFLFGPLAALLLVSRPGHAFANGCGWPARWRGRPSGCSRPEGWAPSSPGPRRFSCRGASWP